MPVEGTDAMTPPPTAPVFDPLTRYRAAVGQGFAALAALFLIAGGYCFYKAYGETPTAEKSGSEPAKPELADDGKEAGAKLQRPYSTEFTIGGLVGVLCALASGAAGGWLIGSPPATDPLGKRGDRLLLFAVSAVLGAALMILGFALFYLWFGELSKWLGQAEKAEPLKPLLAVLGFLLGAGIVFAGVQPMRAEERNDVLLRRIVYGTNFFLTGLLLVVGLVFVNVIVTLKLPSRLDTTESGFYTLSQTTQDYLASLDKEVVIYTTIQEGTEDESGHALGTDVLRVLRAFQEASPKMIKLKQLSLTLDKSEIAALKTKFPTSDLGDAEGRVNKFGIIVAIGPDEKRYQVISMRELFTAEARKVSFNCEPRVIREILFLTENKQKPVVYFTQGAGEISIEVAGPGERKTRTAEQLKQALIADNCEVKPLRFSTLSAEPKVPDDATVVIVADPTAKLSDTTLMALQRYMSTPRADGTKGKLLVIAGAKRDPANPKAILSLGIEKLLADYDITLRDRVLYAEKTDKFPPQFYLAVVSPAMIPVKNTIALTFAERGFGISDARPIVVGNPAAPNPAKTLFIAGMDRITWVEPAIATNPLDAYRTVVAMDQAGRRDLTGPKEISDNFRTVAAVASEVETQSPGSTQPPKSLNRVVVFGYGDFEDSNQPGGRAFQSEVISASINWLRDRPAVANEGAKPYGVYTPNPKWDWSRGFTLPVSAVILGISAIGLGLWVLRRR